MFKRFATWILRKDIEALVEKNGELNLRVVEQATRIKQLEDTIDPKLYADLHDPDRESFWKGLRDGISEDAARAWAFERLNRRLQSLVAITPEHGSDFYVAQGAIAELNNFLRIHKQIAMYLKEDMPSENDEEDEGLSLSESHS